MKTESPKYYGVSTGNGNDGVSHIFADYIVKTDDPWRLAELAAVQSFKPDYQAWVKDNLDIDGEAEYTISAVLYDGPNGYTEFDAAYFILEVFPMGESEEAVKCHSRCPVYNSIEDALEV